MPRILPQSQAKDATAEHHAAGGEPISANQEGATAIEYGLIAALIALACIIAFTSLGLNLAGIFDTISNALR
jgi:pilus assembly protein Flp/PilA